MPVETAPHVGNSLGYRSESFERGIVSKIVMLAADAAYANGLGW